MVRLLGKLQAHLEAGVGVYADHAEKPSRAEFHPQSRGMSPFTDAELEYVTQGRLKN